MMTSRANQEYCLLATCPLSIYQVIARVGINSPFVTPSLAKKGGGGCSAET